MASKSKKTATAKEPEKYYAIEKLRANCRRLFGVSTSTFAGATYGMDGYYTVKQIKSRIEAWGKKGVR